MFILHVFFFMYMEDFCQENDETGFSKFKAGGFHTCMVTWGLARFCKIEIITYFIRNSGNLSASGNVNYLSN